MAFLAPRVGWPLAHGLLWCRQVAPCPSEFPGLPLPGWCFQGSETVSSWCSSIEEGSAELRGQLSRLEEELDQERKKHSMLEIKLRNSERAREDAERRNQLLQKEMEDFFSTLGSLTVGSPGARVPK